MPRGPHRAEFALRLSMLAVILVSWGSCIVGCSFLSKDQETMEAENEIMESIFQARNDAPLSFYEYVAPLDYFRPVCDEKGVLQYKVKRVDAKTIHIENDAGEMRVQVVFESYLPSDQGETSLFNVDLKIEKGDDGW